MTIVKKLLHDFWLVKGKLILCVIAATISAWGISSVIYSYLMSSRDFKVNFEKSNPADFIITIRNDNDSLLQLLKSDSNIRAVERREVLTGRIKNAAGNFMPFILFAVTDLKNPEVSKFQLQENGPVPADRILIEKNSKGFLKDIIGQEIKFGAVTMKFASGGIVHDAGLPPSQMEGTVYLYSSLSFFNRYLDSVNHRYLFSVNVSKPDGALLKNISERISGLIRKGGGNPVSVTIPPPGEHPHQNIVDGVALLQKVFGSILSLLGIILLSLILLTWLYPQITDIGIIKTIGASTRAVFSGYLIVLLLIISAGLLIGLPLGYQTAKFYNRFIAMIQNFQVVKDPLPWTSHLFTIIPSMVVPVLFCIVPLIKTSRASIQTALNRIFYTPHKGLFRLTQRLPGSVKTKYSLNNLFRSNQRTSLLILLLTIGIALFITSANLKYSINKDFDNYFKATNYDIMITLKDSVKDVPSFKNISFIKDVAYLRRKTVQYQSPKKAYRDNKILVTLSPDYKIDNSLFIEGKLQKDCDSCIYINQRFAPEFEGVSLGSPVDIEVNKIKKTFIYSGIIKELTSGPQFYRVSRDTGNWYREIHVRMNEGYPAADAGSILDDSLMYNNITTDRLYNKRDGAEMLQNHLKPTYVIILTMGIFTIVVGLCGMLIVLNLSIKERTREMGIMKAIGGSVNAVSSLFGMEYFIVNLIAVITGIVAGYGLTALLASNFGETMLNIAFNPSVDWKFITVTLLLLLIIQSFLITVYSRRRVKKTSASLLNNIF